MVPSCSKICFNLLRDRVRRLVAVVLLLTLVPLITTAQAKASDSQQIVRIRHFSGPEHTRIVLDLDLAAKYTIRRVKNPERIAVNVAGARFRTAETIAVDDGLVKRIRCNQGRSRSQVVLDLEAGFRVETFKLPATGDSYHRIVVDVFRVEDADAKPQVEPGLPVFQPSQPPFTVVIDPGHGGLDPGAMRDGLKEKDLVLDVAKSMARRIDSLSGYRAVLTRTTDYYPSLARRVEIAAEKGGDLFISVHCNTHRRHQVSGMEVYFLSLQGASDHEAQDLADLENAADLAGLDPQASSNDMVVNILLDLRRTQVLQNSARLAEHLLACTGDETIVKRRKIKQAGFKVLKSLAMPSALVELAYLSNSEDRRLLADSDGRAQLAALLVDAIMTWRQDQEALAFLANDRPASWTRQYKVRRGDSLWELARQCGTTVSEITKRNELNSRSIMVGQRLRLPEVYP